MLCTSGHGPVSVARLHPDVDWLSKQGLATRSSGAQPRRVPTAGFHATDRRRRSATPLGMGDWAVDWAQKVRWHVGRTAVRGYPNAQIVGSGAHRPPHTGFCWLLSMLAICCRSAVRRCGGMASAAAAATRSRRRPSR